MGRPADGCWALFGRPCLPGQSPLALPLTGSASRGWAGPNAVSTHVIQGLRERGVLVFSLVTFKWYFCRLRFGIISKVLFLELGYADSR